jgi:hypothetical protein
MMAMNCRGGLYAVLCAFVVCGFSAAARADLPDATVVSTGEVLIVYDSSAGQDDIQPVDTSSWNFSPTLSTPLRGEGTITATYFLTPAPSIKATVSLTVQGDVDFMLATSHAYMTYYFQIDGPDGTVPVQVHATGMADGDPMNSGLEFEVDPVILDLGLTISDDGVYSFETNTLYGVILAANIHTEIDGFSGSPVTVTRTAFIDPSFNLLTDDPAYSIEFSPGIGNSLPPRPNSRSGR